LEELGSHFYWNHRQGTQIGSRGSINISQKLIFRGYTISHANYVNKGKTDTSKTLTLTKIVDYETLGIYPATISGLRGENNSGRDFYWK
jgi:hypothetical protein